MQRQLKFRAWDKLEKRFIYPDKGYQGHYVLSLDGKFHNLQNGSGGDEYVVQQFTGLKDVEGKEIYEGDILQRRCTRSDYIFKYTCEWSDEESAFMRRNNWDGVMDTFLPDLIKNLKIIGNVFENSEFLNK
jgi:uncharacterized phage protein (TIGR01671 family)